MAAADDIRKYGRGFRRVARVLEVFLPDVGITTDGAADGDTFVFSVASGMFEPGAGGGGGGGISFAGQTRGDLIARGAATWDRLAIGAAGRFLKSDGTDPAWASLTAADVGAGTFPGAVAFTGTATFNALATFGTAAGTTAQFATVDATTHVTADLFDPRAAGNNVRFNTGTTANYFAWGITGGGAELMRLTITNSLRVGTTVGNSAPEIVLPNGRGLSFVNQAGSATSGGVNSTGDDVNIQGQSTTGVVFATGASFSARNSSLVTYLLASLAAGVTSTFEDATTNTVVDQVTVARKTSGTAAAGIGAAVLFRVESDGGSLASAARVAGLLTTVTNGAEVGVWVVSTARAGVMTECARFGAQIVQTAGTVCTPTTVTTTPYTVLPTDSLIYWKVAGAATINLPAPAAGRGILIYEFQGDASTATKTIGRSSGGVKINGVASDSVITTSYRPTSFNTDGTDWGQS